MKERLPGFGFPCKQRAAEPAKQPEDEALFDGGNMHVHDTQVMFLFPAPLERLTSLFFHLEEQIFQ